MSMFSWIQQTFIYQNYYNTFVHIAIIKILINLFFNSHKILNSNLIHNNQVLK